MLRQLPPEQFYPLEDLLLIPILMILYKSFGTRMKPCLFVDSTIRTGLCVAASIYFSKSVFTESGGAPYSPTIMSGSCQALGDHVA